MAPNHAKEAKKFVKKPCLLYTTEPHQPTANCVALARARCFYILFITKQHSIDRL